MYINLHIYKSPTNIDKVTLQDLSKNMKISELQEKIQNIFGIEMTLQKLIHKGKIMCGSNNETLLHYNVNYNETIQVHKRVVLADIDSPNSSSQNAVEPEKEKPKPEENLEDCESELYEIGDLVDV